MLKIIFELLTDPLGLPIPPFWEYVILFVIGETAHELVYWLSPGGKTFGSVIYWVSKLFVFVAVWLIIYGIISAILFVISHWIWFVIVGAVILLISIIFIVCLKKRKKAETKNEN